jgi:hypothetical protein
MSAHRIRLSPLPAFQVNIGLHGGKEMEDMTISKSAQLAEYHVGFHTEHVKEIIKEMS